MPDTGEDREIRQRVNAKEAEIESTATRMRQMIESEDERKTTRRAAKKKSATPVHKHSKPA